MRTSVPYFARDTDVNFLDDSFREDAHSLNAQGSLSRRVADILLRKIREGGLEPGMRLPTEKALGEHFQVSRTVIREAIASLKNEGVVETRQGSGAFVRVPDTKDGVEFAGGSDQSVQALLNVIEVRRAIESETAAIAASRHTAGHMADIHRALAGIAEEVAAGLDGVESDVKFHLSIARATGNPFWERLVLSYAPQIRSAVRITRANEARRDDLAHQVMLEHEQIVAAIQARDPERARLAGAQHMDNAAVRVQAADLQFWQGKGGEYIKDLLKAAKD